MTHAPTAITQKNSTYSTTRKPSFPKMLRKLDEDHQDLIRKGDAKLSIRTELNS